VTDKAEHVVHTEKDVLSYKIEKNRAGKPENYGELKYIYSYHAILRIIQTGFMMG
jgi:hypothetical protein